MKKTRWINFLGASDLIFSLVVIILIGIAFFLFNQVSYIFTPILVLVSNILMPFVIALLLYYLFNPFIDFLEKNKVKRIVGVSILFLLIIGILTLGIFLLYPLLRDQVTMFIEEFPSFINSLTTSVTGWLDDLPFGGEIESFIQEGESFVTGIPDNINRYLSNGFSGLSSFVSGLTNVVVTLITFPIILFFLLKDEQRFFRAFLSVTPPKWREDLIRVSSEVNTQVGAYVKGQLIIASSIGVMMFIGFSIIGLQYNGVLAIIAGFTSIIPYIGPTLAFIPALIIALIDSWWMVAQLVLVWMVVQFIDGNFIEPNIMGKQLNVHPLTIIIVLLVAGDLLGLFGLIFGVPIYAILKVLVVYVFQQFKKRYNKYYGDVAGEYEVKPIEVAVSGEKARSTQLKRTIEIAKLKRHKEKDQYEADHEESSEKDEDQRGNN
ncbi:Predicted PurR-regulated permease PerM [Alkalibacterium subtropicum]|uniref:Predicted PurR-regulated permease PerM n=1 Tax=Alkalibacterium subtropicum TaxID=753702 RepID=A0A1I1F859_9LACT|nr:AI-2E family transporter [Alkalibacterium subtropicum]SFB95575.1 Predicted PurR-regulated permease PerM [Alkalibacterium subtropicum]